MFVTCECKVGPFCEHQEEWWARNRKLLGIRSPHKRMIPHREIVQRVADRNC